MKSNTLLILVCLILLGCKSDPTKSVNHLTLNAKAESGSYQMVVEIPAGTNHKIEINTVSGAFEIDQKDGKDRVVNFLPYPGNYGFIPGTKMSKAEGGDGDALDILLIAETQASGTVVEFIPIAMIELLDNNEIDTKVIAIPADSSLQVIHTADFPSFMIEQDGAKRIIETWFMNYKGLGNMKLVGWKNKQAAIREIEKWTL